ncbi:MAG: alpha/beta hydrolase-fold protein [Burkholderiaceae bacterium]
MTFRTTPGITIAVSARRRVLGAGLASLALGTGCASSAPPASAPSPTPTTTPTPAGSGLRDTGHAVALPDTHEFQMTSAGGRDYRILVAQPSGPVPQQGYGMLVVLDGNWMFGAAAQAMQLLMRFPDLGPGTPGHPKGGRAEPLLVVGIGYPGDDKRAWKERTWDFLPAPHGPIEVQRARLLADPGGAEAFLDFLVDELRPALAARYPLRPDRHTLSGASLGGYFTLHALARRPQAFQRYAAISPSLWWDDRRLLAEMAQARPAGGRVLLALARDELPGYPDRSAGMLDGARRMRELLIGHGYGAESLRYLEVENEDHMSIPFALTPTIVRFAAMP